MRTIQIAPASLAETVVAASDQTFTGGPLEPSPTVTWNEMLLVEGTDYEDTVRNAVSLGGDADTQAAIAGAIAEAFYHGVPDNILAQTWQLLPHDMQDIILRFSNMIGPKSGSQTERAVIIG